MSRFSLEDLKHLMRSAVGEDESRNLDGDVLDVDFTTLGYDSLALMEATSRLERELQISVAEEEVAGSTTPADLLALINDRLITESAVR